MPFRVSRATSWIVKLHANGLVENTFRSIIDSKPIYAVKSMEHAGGQIDGSVVSCFSSLLKDWTRLKELRLINRSSVIMRACPSIIVERQPLTAYTTNNEVSMRQTADTVFRMKKTHSYSIYNPLEFNRPKGTDFNALVKKVETGKAFDVKDSVLTLPAGYTMSTQPKTEPVDIEIHEQKFTATVLSALQIPPSFFNSAKTGSGLGSGQRTEQSENDRHMLMTSVNLTVRDLVHFFRRIYDIIADVDVNVQLPIVSFSTLEELATLYGMNVIGAQTTREHAARHQGIHSDHVIKGKGDLVPKQIEWVPPQKKAKT